MNRFLTNSFRCLLFLVIISLVSLISCSKKAKIDNSLATKSYSISQASSSAPQRNSRLLVKTASLEVSVKSIPEATEAAVKITEKSGGYVRETEVQKDRDAKMNLGIPADRLMIVLDELSQLGIETNRHVSSEDVTDQVVDMEAELLNKRALRDRLRSLLERAKDVKDVLSIESELTRLQTEIDSSEGRLKKMRSDITFSVLSLQLWPMGPEKKKEILGPLGYLYVGTKWFITKLFVIQSGDE